MKLYTAKISPYAAICRMQIYLKNLDVQLLELPHDASWDDIAAVSPLKKMPVLVDGGVVIPESQVILEYLESCFPEPALLPQTLVDSAGVRLISRIADQYIMAAVVALLPHLSKRRRIQEVVDLQLSVLEKGLSSLNHFLPEFGFAVGDQLTLADCTLVPILVFAEKYLPFFGANEPFASYPKVSRYWRDIQQQATAAKIIDEIHQGIADKVVASK